VITFKRGDLDIFVIFIGRGDDDFHKSVRKVGRTSLGVLLLL
jgi:hypothetical protein